MKRFWCLMVCLVCALGWACPALGSEVDSAEYTVAEKLMKQLWAGSGFSGTLTLEAEAKAGSAAMSTRKPIVLGVDYIYVRPTETQTDEHRLDLRLLDGETALSAAHAQLKDGALSVQADVLGADWYSFAGAQEAGVSAETLNAAMAQTGVPGLAGFAVQAYLALRNATGLSMIQDSYTTRVDLWIEGYRQDAVLGKLSDGTTTMEVRYDVPPAAIKAQAKQLVLELLDDEELLDILQQALGAEESMLFLNPHLQDFYFKAIDALPLSGNMTIARTVSVKGDTLKLALSMPLYDAQGGAVTLRYDRQRGEGDLPDDNTITLTSEARTFALTYQEYKSLTGVEVIQGSFVSQPGEQAAYTVDDDAQQALHDALNVAFTLKQETQTSKDEERRDVFDYSATLTLQDAGEGHIAVPDTEVQLTARFVSRELKAAATEMQATLVLGGDGWDNTLTLTAEGRSRKKWEPEALPQQRVLVSQMTQQDVDALLPGAALRGAALLAAYLAPVDAAQPETAGQETPAP